MFQGMEYIYEVYKEKSFSKAAQNLYISQPSLSAAVKKIENRIGCPVFDRSTSPIRLTECGKEYIKCVERILDIQTEFDNYLNNINELHTGKLSIGASNLFASFILPPLISHFTKIYPNVKVNLVEANTALLEERLFSGALDLVIDNYVFADSIYTGYEYCLEHLILAVPKQYQPEHLSSYWLSADDIALDKHKQTDTPAVSLHQFGNNPFLFLRTGNDTRKRADRICQNQGYTPHVILKLDQQVTAYNLCCYGMGIAFVSDNLIKRVKPDENVAYCKINDPETVRSVYFYHKRGAYVSRAMEEFLKTTHFLSLL